MKNPYEVLGISPSATNEEVKKAYRELAKKYHPDNYANSPDAASAEERMKEINEAYDTILRERAAKQSSTNYQSSFRGTQGQGNEIYQRIRVMINEGNYAGADSLLNGIDASARNAEWYFLKGCVLLSKGNYFDALKHVDRAATMDPGNQEYAYMRDRIREQTSSYGNSYQRNQDEGCASMCRLCQCMICTDMLCGRGC